MTTQLGDKWALTAEGFELFLSALDSERTRAGERYEEIRTRLLKFFEWRGCAVAEELTDRTFNRVIGKLQAGETILNPQGYCVGVGRLVHLEYLREAERERQLFEHDQAVARAVSFEEEAPEALRVAAFEKCFDGLLPDQKSQLLAYHTGEKQERINNRKALAARLGTPANSLRIRMFRLRAILEECIKRLLAK
jgi:DNA-directed RNA polymerase specialized sigma24 family protein